MKTTINNSQRKFLVQNQGFGSAKDIFCNLQDIPFVLSEYFEANEDFKVFEYWNRKLKQVSKKRLIELYKANQVSKNIVKTIDITAYEWFDKVNGNSYFACEVFINSGFKSAKKIILPFQYGYGDHFKYEVFKELEKLGILDDIQKYSNGSQESFWSYCDRKKIDLKTRKIENCKKSDLKNLS
jgi:hypothetical protein